MGSIVLLQELGRQFAHWWVYASLRLAKAFGFLVTHCLAEETFLRVELEQFIVVYVWYLKEFLQCVHDRGGLRPEEGAVDDMQLVAAELRQPSLQVVTVLAGVQAAIS